MLAPVVRRAPARAPGPAVLVQSRDEARFVNRAAIVFAGLIVLRAVLTDPLLNSVINYSGEGGTLIEKIHPATYGMLILLVVTLTRVRIVLTRVEVRLIRPLFIFIGVIALLVVMMQVLGRSVSIGYLLETYIAGFLIAFFMFVFPLEKRRMIGTTILAYILVNAVLAILEKVAGQRLLPYPYLELSFRPTALTSHPLVIGLINSGAVVFVLATRWRPALKGLALMIIIMGTFAAGARTGAIIASLASLAALSLTEMPGRSAAERLRWRAILFGSLLFAAPLLLIVADQAGFLERFYGGYIDENAQARIDVYKVFDWVSWGDILIGRDIVEVKKMVMDRLGILVESSVVVFVFQFGLFGALAFAGMLLWSLLRLAAGADPRAYIAVLAFLAVAMSNDSLSGKHWYITMMLVLMIAFRNDSPDAFGRFPRRHWGQA